MTSAKTPVHTALTFAGCTGLAYFGIAFLIQGGGNGWIYGAGATCLGAAVLTWNAHRSVGHQAFLQLGAASANVLVLFIAMGWVDFGASPARALASALFLGILALNIILLAVALGAGRSRRE